MRIHIGKRIWKTAGAVLVCFFVSLLRSRQSLPFFSTITAILCIQPYIGNIGKVAGNQLLGTFVGTVYGVIVLWVFQYVFPEAGTLAVILVTSLCIVPVIETAVLMKKAEISNFVCVVFLGMAVYLFEEGDPFFYVLERVLDTIIGIVVAFLINSLDIPRKRRRDLLFISAIDNGMLSDNHQLSPYSKTELNRMIDDGANFSISTEQTPASLIEFFEGVHFNLPVIAMNGAALYDISSNRYIHKVPLDREVMAVLKGIVDAADMGCFYNCLIQDTLLIYFEDFKNIPMQETFRKLRKNPYRNYVYGRLPEHVKILYLYLMEEAPKIAELVIKIKESAVGEKVRLVTGDLKQYSGYRYLKIYDREATRENMAACLRQIVGVETSVTFGGEEGNYDFVIRNNPEDRMVRIMKSLYRPYLWQKSYDRKMQKIKDRLNKDGDQVK